MLYRTCCSSKLKRSTVSWEVLVTVSMKTVFFLPTASDVFTVSSKVSKLSGACPFVTNLRIGLAPALLNLEFWVSEGLTSACLANL